jgi:hypothetical protein
MAYSIPRDVFLLLEAAFNQDREKAEVFAKAMKALFKLLKTRRMSASRINKESLKAELDNELRAELATKEFVRAEINGVRTEIGQVRAELKQNALLLKILIGIAVFGLTLFNPAFVKLVELVIK